MNLNKLLFSDESGHCGSHQFRSIGVISGARSDAKELNKKLQKVLAETGKKELKFCKIKGHHKTEYAAKEFIRIALDSCRAGKIKIHVITWDTHDSRHRIQSRNDIENLKRMYYKILLVTKHHWQNYINWEFYPDEFSAINWKRDLVEFLENTNLSKDNEWEHSLFGETKNFSFPIIHKCYEQKSVKFPILQLADLFAGLVRFSHEHGADYMVWKEKETSQASLFNEEIEINLAKNQMVKFPVLSFVKDYADSHKMNLNISKYKYLHTFNTKNNLFFWKYIPQSEYDKAPTNKIANT